MPSYLLHRRVYTCIIYIRVCVFPFPQSRWEAVHGGPSQRRFTVPALRDEGRWKAFFFGRSARWSQVCVLCVSMYVCMYINLRVCMSVVRGDGRLRFWTISRVVIGMCGADMDVSCMRVLCMCGCMSVCVACLYACVYLCPY